MSPALSGGVQAAPLVVESPPAGVSFAGTATVAFRQGGPGSPAPIPGATVTLHARLNDLDGDLVTLEQETDAAGIASFTGVPYGLPGGPVVLLDAEATVATTIEHDGCTETQGWGGSARDIVGQPDVTIDVEGSPWATAACPEDGIVKDGTVVVSFRASGAGTALSGAAVTLTGLSGDPLAAVQTLTGTTGEDGTATFTDVARPVLDGHVELRASASLVTASNAPGCDAWMTWSGEAVGEGAAGTVEITIEGKSSTVTDCTPGPGDPLLTGTIVDRDGNPVDADQAWVEEELPGGPSVALPFSTRPDGSFTVRIFPWGTAEAPARLRIRAIGPAEEVEASAPGCVRREAENGDLEVLVALEGGSRPDPVVVVTERTLFVEACGTTGTPRPGSNAGGGPHVTLPPTDTIAAPPDRTGTGGGPLLPAALVTLGVVSLLAAITAVAATATRPRRSS